MRQLVSLRGSNANITRRTRHLSVKFIEQNWLIDDAEPGTVRGQ